MLESPVSVYSPSSTLSFIEQTPFLHFFMCLFCISSDSAKCFMTLATAMTGHPTEFPCRIAANHIAFVWSPLQHVSSKSTYPWMVVNKDCAKLVSVRGRQLGLFPMPHLCFAPGWGHSTIHLHLTTLVEWPFLMLMMHGWCTMTIPSKGKK